MLSKPHEKVPFWIRAEEQYAGRGQGRKIWLTEPGQNLTGTLAVFPDNFKASCQFDLSKAFALATVSFLELFIDDVQIKWPNDLYVGSKKIGGILIETAILGNLVDYAILGIGLNINQLSFPSTVPNPISVSLLTHIAYDLVEMEDLFLQTCVNQFGIIEAGLTNSISEQYVNKLYRHNEFAEFKSGESFFTAKIIGVSEFGHLILQHKSGEIQTFAYQEVEYILST
jgi:BirA family biotin operon repressor/biotin-[acetyl-CoA-carboxylase] ligase